MVKPSSPSPSGQIMQLFLQTKMQKISCIEMFTFRYMFFFCFLLFSPAEKHLLKKTKRWFIYAIIFKTNILLMEIILIQ